LYSIMNRIVFTPSLCKTRSFSSRFRKLTSPVCRGLEHIGWNFDSPACGQAVIVLLGSPTSDARHGPIEKQVVNKPTIGLSEARQLIRNLLNGWITELRSQ